MSQSNKMTIICIEDDHEFGQLMALMLKQAGLEVTCREKGIEGLHAIEDMQPNLVILDLMLPDIHGWEVFAQMQRHETLRNIPVIVVTALSSEADRIFGQDVAGVYAYLVKPFSPRELRSIVLEVLNLQ